MNAVPDHATFVMKDNTARHQLVPQIIAACALKYGLARADLKSAVRVKNCAAARREAAWQIARDTDYSFPAIGRFLNKHHTSIITAIRRVNENTDSNVRGLGGVPAAKRARDRASATARHVCERREDEIQAMRLFKRGKDSFDIAKMLGWRQPRAANALARARDRARG